MMEGLNGGIGPKWGAGRAHDSKFQGYLVSVCASVSALREIFGSECLPRARINRIQHFTSKSAKTLGTVDVKT